MLSFGRSWSRADGLAKSYGYRCAVLIVCHHARARQEKNG